MKQKGTYLVATEMPAQNAMMLFGDIGMDAKTFRERPLQRQQRAYRHGVKMAFGTDATIDLADSTRANQILQQAEIWQEPGLPPALISKCKTVNVDDLMELRTPRSEIRKR